MSSVEIATAGAAWPVTLATPVAAAPAFTAPAFTSPTLTAAGGLERAMRPRSTAALERRLTWERAYRVRLAVTDSVVVLATTVVASLAHLAISAPDWAVEDPWVLARIPLATAVTWLIALWAMQTREPRTTGTGSTEYVRVAHATGLAFGLVAIAFVAFQWPGLRGQLVVGLPLGMLALLASRRMWRRWLYTQRRRGEFVSRALVVGRRADVERVIGTLQRDDRLGYDVVGTTLDGESAAELVVRSRRYPALGTPETAARVARDVGADTIVVASDLADPDVIRRLGWELEGAAADLVLSSRLTDVAGPRIALRHLDGLPLMQVRIPTFDGPRHAYKRALDIAVAAAALVPIALIAPVIALAIAIDSPGPVFYRQRRVGLNGREFDMIKFRTMRVGADAEVEALAAANDGAGLLFKLRSDPRVTRVGAVLRKYSLDELPQFWNVLRGDMSVVGPRPPLPREVGGYDGPVFRRLYIRPGITGLWQISGRSDLSWEESVRLDLHYVENWSVMSDLMIIARTAKVMVRGTGAY
ncbi:sugar transferase [Microbacterium sp. 10M-3C3]|jgi:exopolysaccharide biosynthesis polyprenyl glycosylphosphotransferase|uniref:sugar transferase n=1 Tax=Microbacterium sp. 10M-3C3 TaxID=2483401 RepID=UPI001F0BAF03|nr:sugar transferase [Microbacterium sp. 10M-3C3]